MEEPTTLTDDRDSDRIRLSHVKETSVYCFAPGLEGLTQVNLRVPTGPRSELDSPT